MMSLPHSSRHIIPSEDEHVRAQTLTNHKQSFKILRTFSFLGVLQSKMNFLYTCLYFSLVPKGFALKWSEQTGFDDEDLKTLVQSSLFALQVPLQ